MPGIILQIPPQLPELLSFLNANLSGKHQNSPQFSPNDTDQRGGANQMLAIHIILYIICIPLGFPCFYLSWKTYNYMNGCLCTSVALMLLMTGCHSNYQILTLTDSVHRYHLSNYFEQSTWILTFGDFFTW